jgi:hypothetical protein
MISCVLERPDEPTFVEPWNRDGTVEARRLPHYLLPAFLSHFSSHFHSLPALLALRNEGFTLSQERANSPKPLDFRHSPSIRARGPGVARKILQDIAQLPIEIVDAGLDLVRTKLPHTDCFAALSCGPPRSYRKRMVVSSSRLPRGCFYESETPIHR